MPHPQPRWRPPRSTIRGSRRPSKRLEEPPIPSHVDQPALSGRSSESTDVSVRHPRRRGRARLTRATPAETFVVRSPPRTSAAARETIRLDDVSVSQARAHRLSAGGYWLSDLGSMGGTWVEGTRLNAPRRLAAGDVVDIGLYRLTASFTVGSAKVDAKKTAGRPRSEQPAQSRRRR